MRYEQSRGDCGLPCFGQLNARVRAADQNMVAYNHPLHTIFFNAKDNLKNLIWSVFKYQKNELITRLKQITI